MRRIVIAAASLALFGTLALSASVEAQESPIVGSWVAETWEGYDNPQRGLLIFTETNYSMMFVIPGMIRERYQGDPITDAETLTAFRTLVANSGRYTRDGNEITTEGYVTLDPNYMADWGENHLTYTFEVDGDVLRLTWPGGFLDEPEGFTGTFRRVG
jgi:hypothetical protein